MKFEYLNIILFLNISCNIESTNARTKRILWLLFHTCLRLVGWRLNVKTTTFKSSCYCPVSWDNHIQGQGPIQEFVQGGLNFFLLFQGGLSTRWGLKTPWNQKISLVQGGLSPHSPPPWIRLCTGCPNKHGNSVTNSISSF